MDSSFIKITFTYQNSVQLFFVWTQNLSMFIFQNQANVSCATFPLHNEQHLLVEEWFLCYDVQYMQNFKKINSWLKTSILNVFNSVSISFSKKCQLCHFSTKPLVCRNLCARFSKFWLMAFLCYFEDLDLLCLIHKLTVN